jgi:UDP-N-acetylglucosamine 2-epimerase (non-hydrolysing)
MPEEINRMVTDSITNWFFTTSEWAGGNLVKAGIEDERIFFVGNTMIDSLLANLDRFTAPDIWEEHGLQQGEYFVVTLHRPANVDSSGQFAEMLKAIGRGTRGLPVVFPVHPRTRKQFEEFGLDVNGNGRSNIRVIEAIGYLDFLHCMENARFVLTDSGGIQEETTVLGVPCITARDNTERPVTVTEGTNRVVGRNPERLLEEAKKILHGNGKSGRRPELWDGKAAERIAVVFLHSV